MSKVEDRQGSKRLHILPLILLAVFSTLSILLISYFKLVPSSSNDPSHPPPTPFASLDDVLERGTLRVLTRNTLSTYFEGPTGPAGFEYELLKSFADKLGVELEIPTLEEPELLAVPSGTQSGKKFRLRTKGVPHVNGRGRGDLVVNLIVATPNDLTSEQEDLLRQFAELRSESVADPDDGFFSKVKSAFK